MSKTRINQKYQVIIIGGGPVGLFLGICLHKVGISFKILEKRRKAISHSKSIGIHPVSLELFEEMGMLDQFLDLGLIIKRGHAYVNTQKIGTLNFESCPPPHQYILTIPQYQTEYILEEQLKKVAPGTLERTAEATQIFDAGQSIKINCTNDVGETFDLFADFVIGCDGKESTVRNSAEIAFNGDSYDDTYIMGDFTHNTSLNNDAAIFLHDDGLIESFPLPVKERRWVIKTDHYMTDIERQDIERRVFERIHHDLGIAENFMLSTFGVQHYLAERFVKNRIILAGDAAHVLSPIGGQGMNLGWLDANDLWQVLDEIYKKNGDTATLLKQYEDRRMKAAKKAIRRAEFNMALGRKTKFPQFKKALVWPMLNTPLRHVMARAFTMRGLESWPV